MRPPAAAHAAAHLTMAPDAGLVVICREAGRVSHPLQPRVWGCRIRQGGLQLRQAYLSILQSTRTSQVWPGGRGTGKQDVSVSGITAGLCHFSRTHGRINGTAKARQARQAHEGWLEAFKVGLWRRGCRTVTDSGLPPMNFWPPPSQKKSGTHTQAARGTCRRYLAHLCLGTLALARRVSGPH